MKQHSVHPSEEIKSTKNERNNLIEMMVYNINGLIYGVIKRYLLFAYLCLLDFGYF